MHRPYGLGGICLVLFCFLLGGDETLALSLPLLSYSFTQCAPPSLLYTCIWSISSSFFFSLGFWVGTLHSYSSFSLLSLSFQSISCSVPAEIAAMSSLPCSASRGSHGSPRWQAGYEAVRGAWPPSPAPRSAAMPCPLP